MVLSQKLIASILANVFTIVVAYLITKFGLHESQAVASQVAAGIGILAGALAGWIVKEIPAITQQAVVQLNELQKAADEHSADLVAIRARQEAQADVIHRLVGETEVPVVPPVATATVRPAAPRRPGK